MLSAACLPAPILRWTQTGREEEEEEEEEDRIAGQGKCYQVELIIVREIFWSTKVHKTI